MKISINKTCPVCGKSFEPYHGNQIYCSRACLHSTRLAYQRAYQNNYYHDHKSLCESVSKICPFCGKSFVTNLSFKKFCSESCRIDANAERARNRYAKRVKRTPQLLTKTCAICGKSFQTWFPNKKYCSDSCAYKVTLQRSKAQYYKKLLKDFRK